MYAFLGFVRSCRVVYTIYRRLAFSRLITEPKILQDFVIMEHETHSDNDEHIMDIPNGDDSSSVSHYFSSRSSLAMMDEEASDEGSTSCTSSCDSLWNSMEFVFNLVQIFVALIVLTVAKDEHPHKPLLAWLIGYTCGCIISTLLTLIWFLRKYYEVEEYHTTRYDNSSCFVIYVKQMIMFLCLFAVIEIDGFQYLKLQTEPIFGGSVDGVMADLKIWLRCFLGVWLILGIAWICDSHSSPSDAPKLYRFDSQSCLNKRGLIKL